MDNVKLRLEKKLEEIELQKRIESGNVLSRDDIKVLFEVLKNADQEVAPLLEATEVLCDNLLHTDYVLAETQIKSILGYYNILEGYDIIKSRHQYFFTEERKLVKKPYFAPGKLEKEKTSLNENNIFRKLGMKDEI
jgi:hypothetical protein